MLASLFQMCRREESCPKTMEDDIARIRKNLVSTKYDISNYADSHPLYDRYSDFVIKNAARFSSLLCRGGVGAGYISGVQVTSVQIITIARTLNEKDDLVYRGFAQSIVRYIDLTKTGVELHVHTLCTMKDTGLGGPILKSLEAFAGKRTKVDIETLDSVPNAVGFYEKMGFSRMFPVEPDTSSGLMDDNVGLVPMTKKYGSARLRLKGLRNSHRREKKWDAIFVKPNGQTKTVPFGQKGYSDYTKHHDKTRRQRYIDRHSGMGENWKDPATPGALSRYILWNKKTRRASLADFKKRFHV